MEIGDTIAKDKPNSKDNLIVSCKGGYKSEESKSYNK